LDSTAEKKEAGATTAVGGTTGLHGGGVTGDRPELGSGGQGITAGWPEVRGELGTRLRRWLGAGSPELAGRRRKLAVAGDAR
jgi:hypothetical protein